MRASCRGWSSFRPGNASAVGKQRGLGESTKFLAVHKGFQDILLHFQIAVDDAVKPHSQFGKILHRLADAVIGRDIVGCRFGAEEEAIADVLLEETFAVVAATNNISTDYEIGRAHV